MMIGTQPGVHLFTQISTTNFTFLQVKGLLRQAADREREQEKEKVTRNNLWSPYRHNIFHQESLKRQLKLILDIDPKTPGESLAKELRQVTKTYYHNTIHLCWKYRHFDSSLAKETCKCLVKQLSTEQRFSMHNIEFLNCFY